MSRLPAVFGAFLLGAALLSGCDPNPQVTPTGNGSSATVTPTPVTTTSTTEATPSSTTETTTTTVAPPPTTTVAPPPPVTTHAAAPAPQTHTQASCGADQYRNVDGVCVNRPVAAPGPPAGATAKCKDGTYSFSQHRSGTCSGHGGVAVWL
ncbi:MAG TPA: DUF3761 domain-containing protein [Kutzneria sp.]|jgi:hypothetical protein